MVDEKQSARRPLASFHLREILGAHELRERLADWMKQGLGRPPPTPILEREGRPLGAQPRRDPAECFFPLQQAV
jgi:hypothetical protein